jgi:hypothetical protein
VDGGATFRAVAQPDPHLSQGNSEQEADLVRRHGDWDFIDMTGSREPTIESAIEFFDTIEGQRRSA